MTIAPERISSIAHDGLVFPVTDTGPFEGPIVLLLHGFPQTSTAWTAVSQRLHESGYRTIAPDLRGYSAQARPRGRLNYRSSKIVGDVSALITAIGAGPVHVIGHDWGALLAWSTASAHPEQIRSLTAVSVPHYAAFLLSTLTSNQILRSWYIVLFQLPWIPELLIRAFPEGFRDVLLRSGLSHAQTEQVDREIVQAGLLTSSINWYRGLLVSSQRAMTRPVTVPTTFVWGDEDTLLGPAGAHLTARFAHGSYRLEVLPGVGHWVPDQAPDTLAAIFRRSVEVQR